MKQLTPAGQAVFAVVPVIVAGFYVYLFWCLRRGRIRVSGDHGEGGRWVRRSHEPSEFWRHWWWSFGGFTTIAMVLIGGLAHVYWRHLR
jgi:hypothetical protein